MNLSGPALTRRTTIAALILLASMTRPGLLTAQTSPVPMTPEVRAGSLANGLRYFIRQNQTPAGRVELRLAVNAGSILEDDDQRGLAHFLEHMSFNGTRNFPKNELVAYLQSIGVRFGADLNAYTGFDETVYILPITTADAKVVSKGLTILRDWAGNALLAEDDIEAERGVVLSELRSGKGAQERVREKLFPRLLNGSRYAERLPIGTEQSLKTFKTDALRRFYQDWYRPDLQAVIVVGDIDVDVIEAQVKALFADLAGPSNSRPRPPRVPIPPRTAFDAIVISDPELTATRVDVTHYVRPSEDQSTSADYDRLLLDRLVNGMMGMRLFELTDKPERPFLVAQAQRQPFVRGYETFSATAALGAEDPVATLKVLATEVERARRHGFVAEELDLAKAEVISAFEKAHAEVGRLDSPSLANELVRHFLEGEPVPGIEWEFQRAKALLPSVTLDRINAHRLVVMQEPGHEPFVSITGPREGAASEQALRAALEDVRRADITPYAGSAAPSALLDREPTPGRIVAERADESLGTTTLAFENGAVVVMKPTTLKNDQILLEGTRYGGQFLYDDKDHYTLVHLTGAVGAMGYGSFAPTALQRYLGPRNADLTVGMSPYTEEVSGRSTQADFETLLQLLVLKTTAPRLDEPRFAAWRQSMKGYLATLGNSPESVFEDTVLAIMSQNHPRGPRMARPQDLDQVDPRRAVEIHRERFGNAHGMNFVLVGNFDDARVRPLLAKYIGGLPSSPRESRYRDLGIRPPKEPISREVARGQEDTTTLQVIFAGETAYSQARRLSLEGVGEVLKMRTITRIREELGSSYSPGVSASMRFVPVGHYTLRFSIETAPADLQKVEAALQTIIADLQAKGPTPAELESVKQTWLTEYHRRVQTNEHWANRLELRALEPAADPGGQEYVDRVTALKAGDIQAAATEFANPARRIRVLLRPEAVAVPR